MGVVRGLRSGATGVMDQVVLSGTSLAIGLALARELPGEVFGAYAVTLAISLIGLSLQVSLITDPLVILGAGRSGDEQRSYFGTLLRMQTWAGAGMGVLTAAIAVIGLRMSPGSEVWAAVAGLAIATAPMHLQIFIRSALLARLEPAKALLNDAIHCALRLATLPLLMSLGMLSPFWVFVAQGIASVVSILFAAGLCAEILRPRQAPWGSVAREHWSYGKWMLGASGAHWFSGQSPLVLAAGMLSPLAAAGIKASMYLVSPVNVALTGLDGILAPRASRLASQDAGGLHRFLVRVFMLTTGGSLLYALLLFPVARPIMDIVYKGRYSDFLPIVTILLVDIVIRSMTRAPVLRMKIDQNTHRIFLAHTLCAVTAVIALGLLTPAWGVTGAALSLPIASLVLLTSVLILSRRPWPSRAMKRSSSHVLEPASPSPRPSQGAS